MTGGGPPPRRPRRESAAFRITTPPPRRDSSLYPKVVDPDARPKRAPGAAPEPAKKTPAWMAPAKTTPAAVPGTAPAKKAPARHRRVTVAPEPAPTLKVSAMCELGRHKRCKSRVYTDNPRPGMETEPCQCQAPECRHAGAPPRRRGRPKAE